MQKKQHVLKPRQSWSQVQQVPRHPASVDTKEAGRQQWTRLDKVIHSGQIRKSMMVTKTSVSEIMGPVLIGGSLKATVSIRWARFAFVGQTST